MQQKQAIIEAIKAGEIEKLKELLNKDPNLIHAMTERGESIILQAVYYGQKEIAQFLLSKAMALTIFEAAAVGQKDQIVKALAHNAEHVLHFSADGWTALHLAAFFGHKEIVEVLIQAGAKIIEKLLNAGADRHLKNSNNQTPLDIAEEKGHTVVVDLLRGY